MNGKLREIVFDCAKAPALARFWAGMLEGYEVRPYDDAEIVRLASLGLTPETDPTVLVDGPGPTLCFQQVPSRRYDNNRIHLDIAVPDRAEAVREMIAKGASVVREEVGYTVLADPEGNQFCIVEAG